MFSKNASVIKLHLDDIKDQHGPGKQPPISLLSNRSLNDIIKASVTSVRRVIQTEMQECEIFSILMDETTDVLHTKQVSFRYVHDMEIKELFLQVCNVESTSGDALEKLVMVLLKENNLKIDNIWDQGYDEATNMSGRFK